MKLAILNYLGVATIAVFLLTACDAPDSVRFGNNQQTLSKDLYASIPVDFMNYQIALGDTIEEVQNKLGFYLEMNDYDTYQQAAFSIDLSDNSAKSEVECMFVKQRLVSFKADYELINHEENIEDTLQVLAKIQPSILNLRNELSKNGISMYSLKELGEQVTFTFKKDNFNNYEGCVYQIAYPEFTNNITI
jgi:hypothetical protein